MSIPCEDLATKKELEEFKEEVQELRDQLNGLFGEDESGAVQKIFEIGSTANDAKDTAEFLSWGLTKLRASEALVDIKQAVSGFLPDSLNFAKGKSQWVKVKGSGKTVSAINLDKVSTIAGKSSVASKLSSKVGGGSLAGLSLLSDLIQLQGTLAINIGTVKILDERIEQESRGLGLQIDAVNDGLLRLYGKNKGDISSIKDFLDTLNTDIETEKVNTTANSEELDSIKEKNTDLETDLDEVWQAIQDLRNKNSQVKSEVEELQDVLEETATELTQSIAELEKKLDSSTQIIEDLRTQIKKINEEIDLIKEKIADLEARITKAEEDIETLRTDLETLEDDLRDEIKLVDTRSKSNEADIILLQKKVSKTTFEGMRQKIEDPDAPEEEEVDNADIEELKRYINDKVTALLDAQFTDKIEPAVKVIEDEIKNEDHGLEEIQKYAATAWESIQNDKAMNATTLAFSIHNALMVSNNLSKTINEASKLNFTSLQLKDETGELYDISEAVSSKTQSILTSLSNNEQSQALTARIVKDNRIYQTGINALDTTYSLFDSARTITELTAENTGKIGNALRQSGAIYEDVYPRFLEQVGPQNQSFRKLGSLTEEITNLDGVFSTIEQVSSDVVEFVEVASKLRAEKAILADEIRETVDTESELEKQSKLENITTANITKDAFASSSELSD